MIGAAGIAAAAAATSSAATAASEVDQPFGTGTMGKTVSVAFCGYDEWECMLYGPDAAGSLKLRVTIKYEAKYAENNHASL